MSKTPFIGISSALFDFFYRALEVTADLRLGGDDQPPLYKDVYFLWCKKTDELLSDPQYRPWLEALVDYFSIDADERLSKAAREASRALAKMSSPSYRPGARILGSSILLYNPSSRWQRLIDGLAEHGFTPYERKFLADFVAEQGIENSPPYLAALHNDDALFLRQLFGLPGVVFDRSSHSAALRHFLVYLFGAMDHHLLTFKGNDSVVLLDIWHTTIRGDPAKAWSNAWIFPDRPENFPSVFEAVEKTERIPRINRLGIFFQGFDPLGELRILRRYAADGRVNSPGSPLHGVRLVTGEDRAAIENEQPTASSKPVVPSLPAVVPNPTPTPLNLFDKVLGNALHDCLPAAPFEEVKALYRTLNAGALSSTDSMVREQAERIARSLQDKVVREETERSLLALSEAMTRTRGRNNFYADDNSLKKLEAIFRFVQENGAPSFQEKAGRALAVLEAILKLKPHLRVAALDGKAKGSGLDNGQGKAKGSGLDIGQVASPGPTPQPREDDYRHLFRMVVFRALASCQPEAEEGAPFREVKGLYRSLNGWKLSSTDPMVRGQAERVMQSNRDDFIRKETERSLLALSEAMTRDDFYTQAPSLARLKGVFRFVQKNGEPVAQAEATRALAVLTALEKLPCAQRLDALNGKRALLSRKSRAKGSNIGNGQVASPGPINDKSKDLTPGLKASAEYIRRPAPQAEETDPSVVQLSHRRLPTNWQRLLGSLERMGLSLQARQELEDFIVRHDLHRKNLPRTNFGGQTLFDLKTLFELCVAASSTDHAVPYAMALEHFLRYLDNREQDYALVRVHGTHTVVILDSWQLPSKKAHNAWIFLHRPEDFPKAIFAVEQEKRTFIPNYLGIFFDGPEENRHRVGEVVFRYAGDDNIFQLVGSPLNGAKVGLHPVMREPVDPIAEPPARSLSPPSSGPKVLSFDPVARAYEGANTETLRGERPHNGGSPNKGPKALAGVEAVWDGGVTMIADFPVMGSLALKPQVDLRQSPEEVVFRQPANDEMRPETRDRRPFDSSRARVEGLAPFDYAQGKQGRPGTSLPAEASAKAGDQGPGTYADELGKKGVGIKTRSLPTGRRPTLWATPFRAFPSRTVLRGPALAFR